MILKAFYHHPSLLIQLDGLCISEVVSEVVAEVEEEVEEVEGVGGTSRKALLVLPVSTSIATACKQAQLVKAHGNSITEK